MRLDGLGGRADAELVAETLAELLVCEQRLGAVTARRRLRCRARRRGHSRVASCGSCSSRRRDEARRKWRNSTMKARSPLPTIGREMGMLRCIHPTATGCDWAGTGGAYRRVLRLREVLR